MKGEKIWIYMRKYQKNCTCKIELLWKIIKLYHIKHSVKSVTFILSKYLNNRKTKNMLPQTFWRPTINKDVDEPIRYVHFVKLSHHHHDMSYLIQSVCLHSHESVYMQIYVVLFPFPWFMLTLGTLKQYLLRLPYEKN